MTFPVFLTNYVRKTKTMFNSPVFETVLSLVVVILIFAVLVSCIQEGYVTLFKLRGKMLEFAIKEMLNDRFNKNFAYLLYQHPQIDLQKRKQGDLPSYISSDSFATALIDLIAKESTEVIYEKKDDQLEKKEVLKTELLAENAIKSSGEVPAVEKFKAGIQSLKDSDLKKLLLSFSSDGGTRLLNTGKEVVQDVSLEQLKKRIEEWFNNYMDRVTGWYKRKVRKNIVFASAAVVLFFNLNFLSLTKNIYADSNLREHLTAYADTIQKNPNYIDTLTSKWDSSSLKDINIKALVGVELPIGWESTEKKKAKESWVSYIWQKAVKPNVLGWLIFILALSLGAPFWFDLLKKLVNMRNAGIKPKNSTP